MAEQDDDHRPRGDDAEEGGDLKLLQQIGGGEEVRGIEAAGEQHDADEGEGKEFGPDEGARHGAAHPKSSRRLRRRKMRAAPRLTAVSRTMPWKRGCQSGGRSKTKSRSSIVRRTKAPKIEPMALPAPPKSEVPPMTTEAIELRV